MLLISSLNKSFVVLLGSVTFISFFSFFFFSCLAKSDSRIALDLLLKLTKYVLLPFPNIEITSLITPASLLGTRIILYYPYYYLFLFPFNET